METTTITLPNGFRVSAIKNSMGMIDEIWKENYYDKDFTIKPGMTILDIGANQGFFSLYAASKGAIVYSYEPEQSNYEILQSNIIENNLHQQIFPYNYAIGKKRGCMDLYIQDYSIPFATGMVTSSKEYYKQIVSITNEHKCAIKSVDCLTLVDIINDLKLGKIDLLKIDCEGNELDILLGATFDTMKIIDAVVMETHNSYSQKDLYHCIKNYGYSIVSFDKIEGAFSTGFLFAKRSHLNINNQSARIFSILKGVNSCSVGKTLEFNAAESFSSELNDTQLNHIWHINGGIINVNNPVISFPFTREGIYKLNLQVNDTIHSDCTEKSIYVFGDSDSEFSDTILLDDLDRFKEFSVKSGSTRFHVTKNSISHDWDASFCIIRLTHRDYKVKLKGKVLILSNEWTLNNNYHEIVLDNFPIDKNLYFKLESPCNQEILISYTWINRPLNIEIPEIPNEHLSLYKTVNEISEDTHLIPGMEPVKIYSMKGIKRFIIPEEILPIIWEPDFIMIQINNINWQSEMYREESDCYFEFCAYNLCDSIGKNYLPSFKIPYFLNIINFNNKGRNLEFTLSSAIDRDISITWWPYKSPVPL